MLNHENVVPLLGTIADFGNYPSTGFVSPFMENGNLNSFLKNQAVILSIADRLKIVRAVFELPWYMLELVSETDVRCWRWIILSLADFFKGEYNGCWRRIVHFKSVIHGDLTGTNVLIDRNGKAYIVDFGLSTIKAEFENTPYWPSTVGGAIRWRAPELLPTPSNNYAPVLSSACDVYSFGSLMLQVRDLSIRETFLA